MALFPFHTARAATHVSTDDVVKDVSEDGSKAVKLDELSTSWSVNCPVMDTSELLLLCLSFPLNDSFKRPRPLPPPLPPSSNKPSKSSPSMSVLSLEMPVGGFTPPASSHGFEEDDEGCTTPTASECRIPSVATECPPAPRKRRKFRKRRKEASFRAVWSDNSRHIDFFVPPELETVFTPSHCFNPSPLLEHGAA